MNNIVLPIPVVHGMFLDDFIILFGMSSQVNCKSFFDISALSDTPDVEDSS